MIWRKRNILEDSPLEVHGSGEVVLVNSIDGINSGEPMESKLIIR